MAEQRGGPRKGRDSNRGRGGASRGGSSRSGSRDGRSGSRDGRGRSRDDRGGSGGGRSRDDRGGSRDGRGRSRDDRGGSRGGRSRDDRGGSRDGRGRSRDDRGGSGGGRSRDDRGGSRDGRGRGRDDRGRGRDDRRRFEDAPPRTAGPAKWGGLARVGAARLNDDPWDIEEAEHDLRSEDDAYEDDDEARARREARQAKREAGEANRERLRLEAQAAIRRAGPGAGTAPAARGGSRLARTRPALAPRKLPDPKRQLIDMLGASAGKRAWRDLNEAADHVDAGRVGEARPIANRLYKQTPDVVEVAEIWGLTLYGLGRWHDAIEVLEEVRHLSGLPDQNPVLADAHRAVGNYADVDALWRELSESSPASELVTEGRIVAAGALADQGEMSSAVRLLSKGWKRPKRPLEHHLRRAYALADLYERAGEAPRAKELFGWIAHHEPGWGDARHRSQ